MKNKFIDFRSDTVTLPTHSMKEAIFKAQLGDDVYQEDPTVKKLENLACELFDKEAALFFPTGTMANQAAVMAHTNRGDEIIVDELSHIYLYEVGGISALSGVQPRSVPNNEGQLIPECIENAIRTDNVHFPQTSLICLENSHNLSGGTVINERDISELAIIGEKYNLPLHLDGARIFNAAVSLNTTVKDLTARCDSIMFCLSKGLAAPAGSILVGSEDFVVKARKCRKLLGGGMRQAGILAAAGIVALNEMTERLYHDHQNAQYLAEELANLKEVKIEPEKIQTNIVRFELNEITEDRLDELKKILEKANIKIQFPKNNKVRMVAHKDITKEDVGKTLEVFNGLLD